MTDFEKSMQEISKLAEQFDRDTKAMEGQYIQDTRQVFYRLVSEQLTPRRPGIFGRIARYFRWSWGWLPIPEQDAQALEKLAKEWGIVE